MAALVRIGPLRPEEAFDLSRALAVRGLTGSPVPAQEGFEVEVADSHEDCRRLLHEVESAVGAWLAGDGPGTESVDTSGCRPAVRPETVAWRA